MKEGIHTVTLNVTQEMIDKGRRNNMERNAGALAFCALLPGVICPLSGYGATNGVWVVGRPHRWSHYTFWCNHPTELEEWFRKWEAGELVLPISLLVDICVEFCANPPSAPLVILDWQI